MFVNCFDGYGFCLFAVRVKAGLTAELLGNYLCDVHELVDFWKVDDSPAGAVVNY